MRSRHLIIWLRGTFSALTFGTSLCIKAGNSRASSSDDRGINFIYSTKFIAKRVNDKVGFHLAALL